MHKIIVLIGRFFALAKALVSYLVRTYEKTKFKSFGKESYIGHQCIFSFPTIEIGNHTYIGSKCVFQSTHGRIVIGNHVMFGPGVNIHGGDHIMDRVGVYMDEVHKEAGSDAAVIIEDDVWIGANAMILGGSKNDLVIGRGSVIGAGSVVTKSVLPYSVMVGVPAKCIKKRFTEEQIVKHEAVLSLF